MKPGDGVFASQNFGEKRVAGSYSGSMAYASLGRELRSRKQSGEGYVEATVQTFWKCEVELEGKVSDSSNQEYSVWVVPAPFCAVWFTSHP